MRLRPTQWLIVAFLLLLIFYPEFHCSKKIPPFGVLMIDRSDSMRGAKPGIIDSPFKLKRFEFGSKESGTAIGDGILKVMDRYEETSFIILYSDGANTHGENPIEVASMIGIPVYIIYPSFSPDMKGFISVFGPEIIEEGDTAIFKVHYQTYQTSLLSLLDGGVLDKKEVAGEGVIEFAINPPSGRHTFEFNLSIGEEIIDRTYRNLLVKERPKVLVLTCRLDWNYKFFYHYFKEMGFEVSGIWKKDDLGLSFSDYDIICMINPESNMIEQLGGYIKNGGNAIVVNSSILSTEFLPLIAPKMININTELPIKYYLKPGGIRRGASSIYVMGEKLVYFFNYGDGRVAQFACLDPWRLRLVGKGVYRRDLFGELMSKLLKFLIPVRLNISYPSRLIEGEELKIIFEPIVPDSFILDGQRKNVLDEYIVISQPDRGLHNFRVVFPSSTFVCSLRVMSRRDDRMGIDITMLDAIANISGGGKWEDDFEQSLFGFKEKDLFINLRHNWVFISMLFAILFVDWYFWMKGK